MQRPLRSRKLVLSQPSLILLKNHLVCLQTILPSIISLIFYFLSSAEAAQRLLDSQQIARLASLVPFFSLDALLPPQLLSIGNFLHSKLSTLAHSVRYYSKQYEFVQKQLEDVNRTHMAKLALNDGSEPLTDPTSSVTGPSTEPDNMAEVINNATDLNILDN